MKPVLIGRRIVGLTSITYCTIYIAALKLRDEESKFDVYGTIAHEMCHLAINMLYDNDCKPFKKDDGERAKKYNKVVEITKQKDDYRDVIFARAMNQRESELIVRPIHATVVYWHYKARRKQLEANFSELYKFYHNNLLPDIDKALKDTANGAKKLKEKHDLSIEPDTVNQHESKPCSQEESTSNNCSTPIEQIDTNQHSIEQLQNQSEQLNPWKKFWFVILKLLRFLFIGLLFSCASIITLLLAVDVLNKESSFHEINKNFNKLHDFESLSLREDYIGDLKLKLDIDATRKVLFLKSNCVFITFLAIYQIVSTNDFTKKNIFVNFSDLADKSTSTRILDVYNSYLQPTMIVNCSGIDETKISNFIDKFKKRVILIGDGSVQKFEPIEVEHSWFQLTEDTKQISLKTVINFQGYNITLSAIANIVLMKSEKVFNWIVRSNHEQLKIGQELENNELYVNRLVRMYTNNTKSSIYDPTLRVVLLSDSPGLGKSSALKMIASSLKRTFPAKWVLYFDFNKFKGILSRLSNSMKNIPEFLGLKMMKLTELEYEIFLNLYTNNQVVLFLDGIDNTNPDNFDFLLNLMVDIRTNSENILYIATRPHLKNILIEKLEPSIISLEKIDEENRIEFFKKTFIRMPETEKHKIEENQFLMKTMEISKALDSELDHLNPMLLSMIGKYVLNFPNIDLKNLNLYSMYSLFVEETFKQYLEKAEENNNVDEIIETHQKEAFKLVYGYEKSHKLWQKSLYASKKMTQIGLMYEDDDRIHFVHKTFAEYFVAKYYVQNIFESQNGVNYYAFESFFKPETFFCNGLLMFVDHGVKTSRGSKNHAIVPFLRDFIKIGDYNFIKGFYNKHLFNMVRFFMECDEGIDGMILNYLLRGYFDHLSIFKEVNIDVILEIVETNYEPIQIKNAILFEDENNFNVLHKLFSYENLFRTLSKRTKLDSFIEKILKSCNDSEINEISLPKRPYWEFSTNNTLKIDLFAYKRFYSSKYYRLFLQSRSFSGANLLHKADYLLQGMNELLTELIDNMGLFETKVLLTQMDEHDRNILINLRNITSLNIVWDFIQKNFDVEEQNKYCVQYYSYFNNHNFPKGENVKDYVEFFENICDKTDPKDESRVLVTLCFLVLDSLLVLLFFNILYRFFPDFCTAFIEGTWKI